MTDRKTFVVTIDGSRGVGKTTLAQALRDRGGYRVIDVGVVFRFVCFGSLGDEALITGSRALGLLQSRDFALDVSRGGTHSASAVLWRGTRLDEELWSEVPHEALSAVAEDAEVQKAVETALRSWIAADPGPWILVGRNVGSEIYPHANLKVELTASDAVRLKRKKQEFAGASIGDIASVDVSDPSRLKVKVTKGQLVIDTSDLTPREVLSAVEDAVSSVRQDAALLAPDTGRLAEELDAFRATLSLWERETFGDVSTDQLLLGLTGELGEVTQAVLKRQRGLVADDVAQRLVADGLADMLVFLLGVMAAEGIDTAEVVTRAASVVHRRFQSQ